MPEIRKCAVAGSFIFKFPDGDLTSKPRVALFRRSGAVSTYQHKYAPISGSVEQSDPTPLDTAWRELQEETTLTSTSIRLLAQGKPYSFLDESVGRDWFIHPFAFVLRPDGPGEASLKLDWEHEGYDWFDPALVSDDDSFGGVPRLLESLRRVWPDVDLGSDAGTVLREGLQALQGDHESGARQLASKALAIFLAVLPRLDTSSDRTWWRGVRFTAWHLWKNGRESMGASILCVLLSCLAIIERRLSVSAFSSEVVRDAVRDIADYEAQRKASLSRICDTFTCLLRDKYRSCTNGGTIRILTLSSSSTVLASLTHAMQELPSCRFDIRVLESRPLFEGVSMAQRIQSAIKAGSTSTVTVYTDASAAVAAREVDGVIIGADLINSAGDVSNKTGSLPAVLVARSVSPSSTAVVLSETEKVTPFSPPMQEENDPTEVSRSWGNAVGSADTDALPVKNVYFEWLRAPLLDLYVTDQGVLASRDIMRHADGIREKADKFFRSL